MRKIFFVIFIDHIFRVDHDESGFRGVSPNGKRGNRQILQLRSILHPSTIVCNFHKRSAPSANACRAPSDKSCLSLRYILKLYNFFIMSNKIFPPAHFGLSLKRWHGRQNGFLSRTLKFYKINTLKNMHHLIVVICDLVVALRASEMFDVPKIEAIIFVHQTNSY